MTNQSHLITPPFELMNQWYKKACKDPYNGGKFIMAPVLKEFATTAAQWGADQELEACCEWLGRYTDDHIAIYCFRNDRRPKPPSLKEEALEAARRFYANGHEGRTDEELTDDFHTIRRALGAL